MIQNTELSLTEPRAVFNKPVLRPLQALKMVLATGAIFFVFSIGAKVSAQAKPLNDTGITFCGGAKTGSSTQCFLTLPVGHDAGYGRDAQALTGTLIKIGGSTNSGLNIRDAENGFDYTKISNAGIALQATAVLGVDANEWACTRDNVTGLIWEVKTTSGLRHKDYIYRWFSTSSPDGFPGTPSQIHPSCQTNGACGGCHTNGRCDTEKFTADVNETALCGYTDWRMPTAKELEGILNLGIRSNIDYLYFPNSLPTQYWSSVPAATDSSKAWIVGLESGDVAYGFRQNPHAVRLVRGRK